MQECDKHKDCIGFSLPKTEKAIDPQVGWPSPTTIPPPPGSVPSRIVAFVFTAADGGGGGGGGGGVAVSGDGMDRQA